MYFIKRAYEPANEQDGVRVLVDRIWPRGRSKTDLRIDHWLKDIAPSTELRKWFGHDPRKWNEFRARYAAELDEHPEDIEFLHSLRGKRVTLVFAARDFLHNNAAALAAYLAQAAKKPGSRFRG